MGYDRGDSFPFDFDPNEDPFGSKSKGKLSPRSYPIQCESKWKYSFLSVEARVWKIYNEIYSTFKEASVSRHHGGQVKLP